MPLSAGSSSFIIQRSDAVSTTVLGIEQNSKQLSTQSMTQHRAIYHRSTFHVAAPLSDIYLGRDFFTSYILLYSIQIFYFIHTFLKAILGNPMLAAVALGSCSCTVGSTTGCAT
jgi:hypothetical protein